MRVCPCGGEITQHFLTKNRQAWTCQDCGRYEIFSLKEINAIIQPSSAEPQDKYEGHSLMRFPDGD